MRYLLSVMAVVIGCLECFGQGKEASKRLELYAIEAKVARPDYLCRQLIRTESAENSPIILEADAELIKFVNGKVEYGAYVSVPTYLDKLPRVDEQKAPGIGRFAGRKTVFTHPTGAFSTKEKWEYCDIGTQKFMIRRDATRDGSLFVQETRPEMPHGVQCTPFDPMAWPLLNPVQMLRWGNFQADILDFVRDGLICVSEEQNGKLLKGVWESPHDNPGIPAYHSLELTFDDHLIVESKWELVTLPSKDRRFIAEMQTKWGEKNGESVPVEVDAIVDPMTNPECGRLRWNAKLEWYLPGDKEFEKVKETADALTDAIRKKHPERKIAGAEDPKAAVPKK
jgi:hypothetical protein